MSDRPAAMHGLYVDLVSPCADDGHFLARELHVHLRRMARVRDVQGVIVNGPAGEGAVLDRSMRLKILEVAAAASPAGFPLFAAVPADTGGLADEVHAAEQAGATGIVVMCSGSDEGAVEALDRVVSSVPRLPVVAWDAPADVRAEEVGLAAIVSDGRPQDATRDGACVMLTDRGFDLEALRDGRAAGAILASANLAEAIWGRVFRFAQASPDEARAIFEGRLQAWHAGLLEASGAGPSADRQAAAAIKYALCTMTQNSSAATFPPLVDIGDAARDMIASALVDGRLMPGMG